MSFKKTDRAAVRVIMTNMSLACEKLLYDSRLRTALSLVLACLTRPRFPTMGQLAFRGVFAPAAAVGLTSGNPGCSFLEGVLLPDAKASSIAAVISELKGDSALCARHAMGSVVSVCCFGLAEELGAASKICGGGSTRC